MKHEQILVTCNYRCSSTCFRSFQQNVILWIPACIQAALWDDKASLGLQVPGDGLALSSRDVRGQSWTGRNAQKFLNEQWRDNEDKALVPKSFYDFPIGGT